MTADGRLGSGHMQHSVRWQVSEGREDGLSGPREGCLLQLRLLFGREARRTELKRGLSTAHTRSSFTGSRFSILAISVVPGKGTVARRCSGNVHGISRSVSPEPQSCASYLVLASLCFALDRWHDWPVGLEGANSDLLKTHFRGRCYLLSWQRITGTSESCQ